MVLENAKVEQVPAEAYAQEHHILVAARVDDNATMQMMIVANHARWACG